MQKGREARLRENALQAGRRSRVFSAILGDEVYSIRKCLTRQRCVTRTLVCLLVQLQLHALCPFQGVLTVKYPCHRCLVIKLYCKRVYSSKLAQRLSDSVCDSSLAGSLVCQT